MSADLCFIHGRPHPCLSCYLHNIGAKPCPVIDGLVKCEHEKGTRIKRHDGDGSGYLVWRCIACGWETVDDMP